MPLPVPSHLQFSVMSILLDGEKSGRRIREQLAEAGIRKSGPAFYQMMARLEDANWVKGWYVEKVVEGQMIRERRYKLLAQGAAAYRQTRDFYVHHLGSLGVSYGN